MFWYLLHLCRLLKRSSTRQGESRRILVLGSLGVGKSSLVNMLIGKSVAPVSSDIGVAHPAIVEYAIPLSEIREHPPSNPDLMLKFYDTLGLEHRPSPWSAIKAHMKRNGGVDAVVYCMRRGRLSNEQVTHLRTVWKTYCRGDVPLLVVISGVDFRRGSTDKWWEANVEDLKSTVQVGFTDHLCLNTWDPTHPSWKHQGVSYEEAQRHARDLVIRHSNTLRSTL